MSENTVTTSSNSPALFDKSNYIWMLLGVVVIALGMFLMAGGRSENPGEFKPEEVYSTTRITVAPILIFIGLAIECYAIFKKSK